MIPILKYIFEEYCSAFISSANEHITRIGGTDYFPPKGFTSPSHVTKLRAGRDTGQKFCSQAIIPVLLVLKARAVSRR